VVIDRYSCAFTVEKNSLVTYAKNSDGFSCIHNPQGGGKDTEPDYGLLVYGGYYYSLTASEAEAASLEPPEETLLSVEDVVSQARLDEIIMAAMGVHKREPAGWAYYQLSDGSKAQTPFYIWGKSIAGKTRYALMYVVIHGDAFIHVKVESPKPFTKKQVAWFSSKLELLEIPPNEQED
jgi:hypothetical protein